jgi:ketosteroid isomerase-like protein
MKLEDPRAERALATVEAMWAAYEAASPEFFDFFTKDASLFSMSIPTRIRQDAYRQYFAPHLGEQRRASQILDPEVHLVGDGAVVTYHNRIRVNYNSVDSRATLLLVAEGDRLKIAHLHMSPLASPSATGTSELVEDIVGLREEED